MESRWRVDEVKRLKNNPEGNKKENNNYINSCAQQG